MLKFKIWEDEFGNNNTDAIRLSDEVFIREITGNVEETISIPATARFALFQTDVTELWVAVGSTPITVPSGDLDSQTINLNPDTRYISGEDTIRIISSSAGKVVVSFYG